MGQLGERLKGLPRLTIPRGTTRPKRIVSRRAHVAGDVTVEYMNGAAIVSRRTHVAGEVTVEYMKANENKTRWKHGQVTRMCQSKEFSPTVELATVLRSTTL